MTKAYYAAHAERIKARVRKYAEAHPEQVKAYKKAWNERHRDAIRAKKAAVYRANRDAISAKRKAQYRADPSDAKARAKAYREANPTKAKIAVELWRQVNTSRLKAMKAEWSRADYRRHPEKYREFQSRRRALKLRTQTEPIDFRQILRDSKGICGICKEPLDLFGIDFDHVIPLACGGTHTRDNIQATHSRCNQRKGARLA